jgi:hypothetical protein
VSHDDRPGKTFLCRRREQLDAQLLAPLSNETAGVSLSAIFFVYKKIDSSQLTLQLMRPCRERLAVALAACCICLGGCRQEPTHQFPVSGTVRFQGQPLDQGRIQFDPASDDIGTFSGAKIQDGKYSIPAESGLAPGNYRIRISSAEPAAEKPLEAPGESGTPAKDRIPAKYNAETTLKAEVKRDVDNKIDFDLQ